MFFAACRMPPSRFLRGQRVTHYDQYEFNLIATIIFSCLFNSFFLFYYTNRYNDFLNKLAVRNAAKKRMDEKDRIFLTRKELLRAVRIDFKQYGPQFDLFQDLCPIITGNTTIVIKDKNNDCALITRGKKSKTRRMREHELGDYLFKKLSKNDYPLSVLAEICRRVFETRASPGRHPVSGNEGIWIETDMALFHCTQCGDCCRNLLYHNDCTEEDYSLWGSLGRADIMKKVMIISSGDRITGYRIWMNPDTGQLYPQCPWMKPTPAKNRYACLIQDVKPEICRQYPYTRKHAIMTGCRGKFKDRD